MSRAGGQSRRLGRILLLCGTAALLWYFSGALSAQTTSGLSVSLNATSFATGQTLVVRARLTPLAPPRTVDAYVVVQLPSGQFLSLQLDGSLVAGLHPIARNVVPFDLEGTLAQYTFTGNEPAGTYTWYAVLTEPGTMNFVSMLNDAIFVLELVTRGRARLSSAISARRCRRATPAVRRGVPGDD